MLLKLGVYSGVQWYKVHKSRFGRFTGWEIATENTHRQNDDLISLFLFKKNKLD